MVMASTPAATVTVILRKMRMAEASQMMVARDILSVSGGSQKLFVKFSCG
jgi:hypothetical protein